MKKKLLIALFVVLLSCFFALTVSAANEVTLTDGTQADLSTVFKINSSNQITGFQSGYDKNMVTDVIFPDEIEGIEANFLFGSSTSIKTLTFAGADEFFISGDGIFSNCSVEKITFDPDCIVEIRKGNFYGCKSLTEITFPKFRKLAGSAFASCTNMVSTNELILCEGMTEIGGHAFNGCTSLTGTVYFPSTLEKIQEYSFENTGFTYFDLSKCSSLTAVGGGYGGPFTNNDSITKLDLSGCTSLTSLKNSFAQGCDNLTEVILPPNLETIPHKAFAHCYKLQSIVLPESVTYVADEAFHSARANQDVKTFTVYLQSYVNFHEKYPFRDSSAKIEYVLIGEGMTASGFIAANTFSGITGAEVVDYVGASNPYNYTVAQSITTHRVVENYCASLALEGAHKNVGNACVILCPSCGLSASLENPEHALAVYFAYENGYMSAGEKITHCTNEGCSHETKETAGALFTYLGYSVAEYGMAGVDIGYKVNRAEVSEYEAVMGEKLNYGVFAVIEKTVGKNDIFDANGKALDGVISADMTETEYSIFKLKMVGFDSEQKDISFAMGAYVGFTKDEKTEYTYFQIADASEGEKYFFASLNEILAIS